MTWAFRFAAESFPQKQEFVKIPNEICVNGIGKDPHKKHKIPIAEVAIFESGQIWLHFHQAGYP